MSPIEYIKEGIRLGNWEAVCEGYERLTGTALPLPSTATMTDSAENALQRIANITYSVLNGPRAEICEKTAKQAKRKPGRPKGSGKKQTKTKATVTGDGKDSSLQLDDSNKTIVQKNAGTTQLITNDPDPEEVAANKAKAEKANKNKRKLQRQVAMTYEVQCNECDKPFQSNRKTGKMGQKCSACLKGLKGRFS